MAFAGASGDRAFPLPRPRGSRAERGIGRRDATMRGSNPYLVLGVSPDATKAEIRKAYRRLAKRYHPDLNGGDADAAERFKEVQAAYEALLGEAVRPQARPHGDARVAEDDDPFARFWAAYVARRRREAGRSADDADRPGGRPGP